MYPNPEAICETEQWIKVLRHQVTLPNEKHLSTLFPNYDNTHWPSKCSIHVQQCLQRETKQQVCKPGALEQRDQIDTVLLVRTLLELLPQNANQMKSELMSLESHKQQVQKRVKKFQHLQAEDDETCMQLQTYMIQFSCNRDMHFLPEKFIKTSKIWSLLCIHA